MLSIDACCRAVRVFEPDRDVGSRGISAATGLGSLGSCLVLIFVGPVGVRRPLPTGLSFVEGLSRDAGDIALFWADPRGSLSLEPLRSEVSTAGPKLFPCFARAELTGGGPFVRGFGACCCGGGPEGACATEALGSFDPAPGPWSCADPGAIPLESLPFTLGCPFCRLVGPVEVSRVEMLLSLLGSGKEEVDPSRDERPRFAPIPDFSLPLGLLDPGTRSPDGVCRICWSLGYRILVVSSR
jgi:hypothetical protein